MTDIPDKAVEAAQAAWRVQTRNFAEPDARWRAALSAASPFMGALGVREFANAILHGDDEHRAWLLEAADAFVAGKPLPEPRGKGVAAPPVRQEALEALEALKPFAHASMFETRPRGVSLIGWQDGTDAIAVVRTARDVRRRLAAVLATEAREGE